MGDGAYTVQLYNVRGDIIFSFLTYGYEENALKVSQVEGNRILNYSKQIKQNPYRISSLITQ